MYRYHPSAFFPFRLRFASPVSVVTLAVLMGSHTTSEAQRPRVVPVPPQSSPQHPTSPPAVPSPNQAPPVVSFAEPAEVDETIATPALIAAVKAQNEAIRHRLKHRLVNSAWKPGLAKSGAAGMNLFSVADHQSKSYVRNPDLWAADLVKYLTGVVIYNDFTQESYGGVLITPRHLLFCAHAHPHAHQTWGPDPSRPGATHRFLTKDGRLVESLQLHQAKSSYPNPMPGLGSLDLCVAVLDRDMEAEGLAVVPIFPPVGDASVAAATEWARTSGQPFAFIGIGQGTSRPTNTEPPEPIADYPRRHQRMCYIKDRFDPVNANARPSPFAAWNYAVWDGDSGTPAFLLLDGVPHLWMILTTAPGNGPRPGSFVGHVNALIAAADESAIELGRIEKPTGLRVRVGSFKP